jgi:hypothetical protein
MNAQTPTRTGPLVVAKDLARFFDVSKPLLNRLIERTGRQVLRAVDGVDFEIARGQTLAWWANPVAASRPWRGWSSGSTSPAAARCPSTARTWPA